MVIDRSRYMNDQEVRQLRTVTEAKAIVDLKKGRIGGILAWMVLDLALSTGLRVSEIVALKIKDVDIKRGALKSGLTRIPLENDNKKTGGFGYRC